MENDFLIVTGEMRSGTTFLANLLNSQPQVHIACDFVRTPFFESRKLKIANLSADLSEREMNVLRSNLSAESTLMGYDTTWLRSGKFDSVIDLIKLTYRNLDSEAEISGSKITCLRFDEIRQLLSRGFKVIYIVRDPRDVTISSKNRFSHFSLFKQVDEYKLGVSNILKIDDPNFVVVRFEDLILKNEETLNSIAKLLKRERIITDLDSLKIRNLGKFTDNSSFNDIDRLFDRRAIFRWKAKASDLEVKFVSVMLQDLIEKFNYECPKVNEKELTGLLRSYRKQRLKIRIRSIIKSILAS